MPRKNRGIKKQILLVRFAKILGSLVIIGVIVMLMPLSLPRLFGYETYDVVSGSMEPEIPVGSLLLVKPVEDKSTLAEGDIICFYNNATVVSHRVIYNNLFEGKITTKGDANEEPDISPVLYDDVIGKVEHHYEVLGALGSYFSTAAGKLLLGELIICAFLLYIVAGKIKI